MLSLNELSLMTLTNERLIFVLETESKLMRTVAELELIRRLKDAPTALEIEELESKIEELESKIEELESKIEELDS